MPFPDASGFSSGTGFTALFTMLFAEDRAEDRGEPSAARAGRGTAMLTEFLGLVLISLVLVFQDHLLLSGDEAVDARGLLLVEGLGDISVVC
jgi:hypothetical protein